MAEAPDPGRPIRVAAISDLHGFLPADFPRCDVAVLAGDVFPIEDHSLRNQRDWAVEILAPWLAQLPADSVVSVAGNHDLILEFVQPPIPATLPWWTYLQDEAVTARRLRIWGSPWVPWLAHGWAFQSDPRHPERFLAKRYAPIPTGVDVLVSHGPPKGLLDRTIRGASVGSAALRDTLARTRPRICVVGHVHESRGLVRDPDSGVLVVNVSAVDADYQPWGMPIPVFDLPPDGGPVTVVAGFN